MLADIFFFLAESATATAAAASGTNFRDALSVIAGLIVIEGLLSVDNALAIAAMASHLDEKRRALAMNIGYIGAYGFRVLALIFASYLVGVDWVMWVGAGYLIWLMCSHFASHKDTGGAEGEVVDIHHRTFASTIVMISLMDLSLSVDNVVTAVGLSHDNMTYVYIGVTIGIITLRMVAGIAVKLIEKYPILEHAAFVLIGYVGMILVYEVVTHVHLEKYVKFIGIVVILALCILYSQSDAVARALRPLLRVFLLPMELIAGVVGGVFLVISWPFKKLIAQFSAKPATANGTDELPPS
jgi:tellurite resistance protein TerC